ncbi:MAG: glycosyltransferase [Nanoarchaeota archaeon]
MKQKTKESPGIIVLTHNEVLFGVATKSSEMKKYLTETADKEWLYGVHIQGDCSNLKEWPLAPWQNFIMWTDKKSPFLANVSPQKIIGINCINFITNITPSLRPEKYYDICVVSRPSKIKRITETILTLKRLMTLRPQTTAIFIVPDARDITRGEKTYEKDRIDRNYFELFMQIFSSKELKQISFISSSNKSFGMFPISHKLVTDIMRQSRFMMLISHREGVPRVLVESLLVGTPCILSRNLRCGLMDIIDNNNTLFLEDSVETDAISIAEALENMNRFHVNTASLERFLAVNNISYLKNWLSNSIKQLGYPVEGEWYLENLLMRLAGHGVKHNFQFGNNVEPFFHWLKSVEKEPYNEDVSWQESKKTSLLERKINILSERIRRVRNYIKKITQLSNHNYDKST